MILHNVMWESRPLPKIVRDPLAALSARGSFFVPAPPGIFLFWDGRQASGDLKREKLAGRETFLEKGSPSPRPALPKTFVGGSAGMEEPVKKNRRLPAPKLCTRAAWKSVPFEAESVGGKERKGIAGARQRLSRGSLANGCRFSAM